jgi:hypothetical protein
MYAAGHPPLPPFELASFCRDQPMHYLPAKESKFIKLVAKDPVKSWELYHYSPDEVQQTRIIAVGILTAVRAAVGSVRVEAAKRSKDPANPLLDYAHFDCYACHHDLKSPSWRQARGYNGVPGRPQLRPGCFPGLKIVLQHATRCTDKRSELNVERFQQVIEQMDELTALFSQTPFGAADKIQPAAQRLEESLCHAIAELDKVIYSEKETKKLLQSMVDHVCTPPANKKDFWLDPDSAQQLTWAIEVLREELEGDHDKNKQPLAAVFEKHPTACPTRRVRLAEKIPADKSLLLIDALPGRLKQINDFEFDPFRKVFEDLKTQLPK